LAAQAGTDIKMTSQVLQKPGEKGLIERDVDPADTRARRLRVLGRDPKQRPLTSAPIGTFANGVLLRRQGTGSFAGDPYLQRQGSHADVHHG
jgi:hypothetical protein